MYPDAETLETLLGDPRIAGNPLSFEAARRLDEADAARDPFFTHLWDRGFAGHYVPVSLGGALRNADSAGELFRCIARRDVTTAHQFGNQFLGSVPVWLAGNDAQQQLTARALLDRKRMAFALTEREHGADLLANAVTARAVADGYELHGEKWLISQGATSDFATIMARTGESGDPRGFSIFLVDKRQLSGDQYQALSRIPTMGLRGADISGFSFDHAIVPDSCLVGTRGHALDITIRTLLASKVVVVALALAAADSGLRTALDFAASRVLYGQPVASIGHARTVLARCFANLLMADACFRMTARGMSAMPEQLSVHANVAKILIPELCSAVLADSSTILGARFYLRNEPDSGVFEKMQRDNAIISVFDGSSIACLSALSAQMPLLTQRMGEPLSPDNADRLYALSNLSAKIPDLSFTAIDLQSRGRDDLLRGLDAALTRARELPGRGGRIAHLGDLFFSRARTLAVRLERLRSDLKAEASRSYEMYELAKEYAVACAAAGAIHLWIHSRNETGGAFAEGAWLELGLTQLAIRAQLPAPEVDRDCIDVVFSEAVERLTADRMLGVVPTQLARRGSHATAGRL